MDNCKSMCKKTGKRCTRKAVLLGYCNAHFNLARDNGELEEDD
jgi:hypothetical protein